MWKLTVAQKLAAAERYEAGESTFQIGDSFGVSDVAIRKLLQRRGIVMRSNSESHVTHSVNHASFDFLTDDALYWAGFLAADGCLPVPRDGRAPEVAVALAETDRDHLVKLRDFLGSTHAITAIPLQEGGWGRCGAVRYSVRSRRLHERLSDLGVRGPELSPDLICSRHFWRGVVDGDGWIGDHRMEVVGYPYVVRPFVDFLCENGIRTNARPHKSIERVEFGGRTADRVVDLLYRDCSLALTRKHINAAKNILTAAGLAVARGNPGDACGADVRHSGTPRVQSAVKQEPQPARAGIPRL
jgi:hypothetical protein